MRRGELLQVEILKTCLAAFQTNILLILSIWVGNLINHEITSREVFGDSTSTARLEIFLIVGVGVISRLLMADADIRPGAKNTEFRWNRRFGSFHLKSFIPGNERKLNNTVNKRSYRSGFKNSKQS